MCILPIAIQMRKYYNINVIKRERKKSPLEKKLKKLKKTHDKRKKMCYNKSTEKGRADKLQ